MMPRRQLNMVWTGSWCQIMGLDSLTGCQPLWDGKCLHWNSHLYFSFDHLCDYPSLYIYFCMNTQDRICRNICKISDFKFSGSIPESGRSPELGNGNPLQYSSLENPMDRGGWWASVQGVAKSWTRLSDSACARAHGHLPKLDYYSICL